MTNTLTMELLLSLITGIVHNQESSTLTCHQSKSLLHPLESKVTLLWLKKQLEMGKRMTTVGTSSQLSIVVQSTPLLWKKAMRCFEFNLLLSILSCIRTNATGLILMPPLKSSISCQSMSLSTASKTWNRHHYICFPRTLSLKSKPTVKPNWILATVPKQSMILQPASIATKSLQVQSSL